MEVKIRKSTKDLLKVKELPSFPRFYLCVGGFFFILDEAPPPPPPLFKNVNGIKNYSPALKQPQLITAPQYLHVAMIQLSVVENIGD